MLHDPAFEVLLPFLQQHNGKTLWVADENALITVIAVAPYAELVIVSNRFDVAVAAKQSGHIADFSDFPSTSINLTLIPLGKTLVQCHIQE